MLVDWNWNLSKLHPRLDVRCFDIEAKQMMNLLYYPYRITYYMGRRYKMPIRFHLKKNRDKLEKEFFT